MTQIRESTQTTRPLPDEAVLPEQGPGSASAILRTVGALAVLVVGAVHLYEYFADYFRVVPIIGPLFALNFAGATVIGLGLLVSSTRLRRVACPARARGDRAGGDVVRLPAHQRAPAAVRVRGLRL